MKPHLTVIEFTQIRDGFDMFLENLDRLVHKLETADSSLSEIRILQKFLHRRRYKRQRRTDFMQELRMEFKFIFIALPLFLLQLRFEFLMMLTNAPFSQIKSHPYRNRKNDNQIDQLRPHRRIPRMKDFYVNDGRRPVPQSVTVGRINDKGITSRTKAQIRCRRRLAVSKMPVFIQPHQHITIPVSFRIDIMHGRETESKIILRTA